ncbi:Metallophosphoesterase [Mycolicibacterium smegmatis MC2 155]|uniref:Metallophosphoesterase n=1 Tax=Mycolicibacterium smegmatis (strain ATCC 700084 / mc(2)155) TaxID=246196 RepID=I7GFP8_MYCS2|nr:Metallophosphoesterase [Mycolicibacterium smegmatis MC2 155]
MVCPQLLQQYVRERVPGSQPTRVCPGSCSTPHASHRSGATSAHATAQTVAATGDRKLDFACPCARVLSPPVEYFTADLHLAHPKLARLRGFDTVASHDAAVMAQLYRLSPETDELWVLGDICSGGVASMESALAQLSTLHVPMHLVTGNHDPVSPMYRNAQKHFADYAVVFASVQQVARTKVGGEGVMLSHFPYAGTPDRFSRKSFDQYQLPDLGMWLIHGHTHSGERRSGKRSICVSLEAWDLRPASAEEITAEMQLR